jgi:hypothetical protein
MDQSEGGTFLKEIFKRLKSIFPSLFIYPSVGYQLTWQLHHPSELLPVYYQIRKQLSQNPIQSESFHFDW